jgi:branched-subunit amino acid ABC-type transport system permease component
MLGIQLVSYGLLLASTYALIACGLVLVFSIVEIPNFAQAGIFMVGGYVSYEFFATAHIPAVVSMVPAFVVCGLLGAVLWYGVMRPLLNRPRADMFVTTFGALAVLQSACALIFGPETKGYPVIGDGDKVLAKLFPVERLWVVGVAIVVALLLLWLIEGTMIGRAMRAVAQNRVAADAMGMNSARIALIAVVLASGLGGIAGSLLGGITGVQPNAGADVLLRVFAIVVLGGMGSLRGAIIGSVLLGLIESVVSYYASDYTDLCFFGAMFVVLLIRPQGILSSGQTGRLETV